MRKITGMVLAGLVAAVFCSSVFAQDKESAMDKDAMKPGIMGQGMMGQGMMGQGMIDKGKMMEMGKKMMSKSVVATSDGGVVVLIGNKLQKYDKNLELKKEVEIKVDMGSMRKMKNKMMGGCKMDTEKTAEGAMESESVEGSGEQEVSQE